MTTRSTRSVAPEGKYAYVTPLPDPPRVADSPEQYKHMARADQTLETWLRRRENTLIDGEGYLCFSRSDPRRTWVAPDCIIAFDIDLELYNHYNGYVISAMGKPPDLVMEVASKSTGRRDCTTKRDQYANFGVGEYWRFDPTGGRNYDRPLAGDRLSNGRYEPFDIHYEDDGLIWGYSPTLGLELVWDDGQLFFRNPATGEILLSQPQTQEALAATQDALTAAETRATNAETRAIGAETRAAEAEARAAAAQAEAQRLRAKLRRQPRAGSEPEPE